MILRLPDELLLYIIDYLAYLPNLPDMHQIYLYVSPELCSLSVVNWQLRRICLPFLFAHIHIKNVEAARTLWDLRMTSSLCSTLTRSLTPTFRYNMEQGREIICKILPLLKRLSFVDTKGFRLDTSTLNVIIEHPTISAVWIQSLRDIPKGPLPVNLSKIVLEHVEVFLRPVETHSCWLPKVDKCLKRGMKTAQLEISTPELFHDFDFVNLKGLQEVVLHLGFGHVSFSWLPAFTAAHPHLKKLRQYRNSRRSC